MKEVYYMSRWTVGRIVKIIEDNRLTIGEYLIIRDINDITVKSKWAAIMKGVNEGKFKIETIHEGTCFKVTLKIDMDEK